MRLLAGALGAVIVISVFADMVNTLVATQMNRHRWWLTNRLYKVAWAIVRWMAARIQSDKRRELLLSTFAPASVLALLVVWVAQQILGYALLWWAIGGVAGADGLADSIYFSGVVFFTVGFGELVPAEVIPRMGALLEAFSGVLTIALVIGYLPALYAAYSERERRLMLLDDGTEQRITPTSLVLNRSPGGDPAELDAFFKEWEEWTAAVLETHTAFPMLVLFRSKSPGQHWVTALGLVADAALHLHMVRGLERGPQYWMLRRAIMLFDVVTEGADISPYRAVLESNQQEGSDLFLDLHASMSAHGFDVIPIEEARDRARELRTRFAPQLEYLIDFLLAPRGFWGHAIGHRLGDQDSVADEGYA